MPAAGTATSPAPDIPHFCFLLRGKGKVDDLNIVVYYSATVTLAKDGS